jgi:unsaturated pyranuronate lyase
VETFAEIGSIGPQRIWEGVTGRTVHGERVTLSLIELDAAAIVPEHSHENEQIGILLQGSMRFEIGGQTREVVPGGTWRILAHVPHSVEVGPDGAVIVEVFSPVRDDWQAIEVEAPRPGRWEP